jgi:hypothetical protein
MGDDGGGDDGDGGLHRRTPTAAQKKTGRDGDGNEPAELLRERLDLGEQDMGEQAPLLGDSEGRDGSSSDDDDGSSEAGAGPAWAGAGDGFDEWEGLPWYRKPSVSWSPGCFARDCG